MFYYLVWVRSSQYRGNESLTYSSTVRLRIGQLVWVPLRSSEVVAVVVDATTKPRFATKPITTVLEVPLLPQALLHLGSWLQAFYPAPLGSIAQQILPREISPRRLADISAIAPHIQPHDLPPLTTAQVRALKRLSRPDTYILHGRTGSGKTRIYSELILRTLAANKSVLLLSPEIGLTSQLATTLRHQFADQVIVLHSQLTAKEREIAWLTILTSATPLVIVGPRSALFSPIQSLGLIIVDESHDTAYKQEQAPYYHAVRVASQLARLHQATLVLGSATPSVTDYYIASQKQKPIIRMSELAITSQAKLDVHIVDLKDRSLFSRSPHISLPLLDALTHSLEHGQQAMLYLNRRGTARVTLCEQCGWQATCPHCDIPLTYHADDHLLRCHTCGYKQTPVITCPVCHSPAIIFKSVGTKALVDETQRVFPEARIVRFDTDNLKADRLEQQYHNIIAGKFDILIGTQILAKGLDLPKLSTLGIIMADSSLALPDFTAQERTYQSLAQVLGRIGRGHIDSTAIIQTYNPDSPVLQSAITDDWQTFYNSELAERQRYLFPPFRYLLKLTCRRATAASAEKTAAKLKAIILDLGLPLEIDGPAPSFREKTSGKYEWQLVIKARDRQQLTALLSHVPLTNWTYNLDPIDLL